MQEKKKKNDRPHLRPLDDPLKVLLGRAQTLVVQLEDLLEAAGLGWFGYKLDGEQVLLRILRHDKITFATGHQTTVQALEFILEHRPERVESIVTPGMVSHILGPGKSAAAALLGLKQARSERVKFTEEIRAAIEEVYSLESDEGIED